MGRPHQRRRLTLTALAALGAACGVAGMARAQRHWLIGTWAGRTENVRSRVNEDRTLTVARVAADGKSATGTFNAGGVVVRPKIAIDGDRISFVSGTASSGATYELTRRGNELVGIRSGHTPAGNRPSQTTISLVRQ
ncbi:MAG TPA: hypothetical protein VJ890_07085 [Vineibacter sp.]|nr:hypothetical protein [Vineibacter sp.]